MDTLTSSSSGMSAEATSADGEEKRRPAQDLRLRRSSPSLMPSCSGSSISGCEDDSVQTSESTATTMQTNSCNLTFHKVISSTTFSKRLSRQSSLSWGHKPSPLIGASCFLFLLPIPFQLRACCPVSAFSLLSVAVSSYLSDHVFTGLESWAHTLDRVLAPMAFTTCLIMIHQLFGVFWSLLSLAPLKCHVLANYYSKHGMYEQFVIWHSLWHAMGVGLILIAFASNEAVVGKCWEGSGWENTFHERFMI
mmetsp:Transcript_17999/g.38852  ORF Transcript_17999/g.38852 Transcript_17999/m.38852 type:complete len:250 (+) Transcript_17999:58-807(+)